MRPRGIANWVFTTGFTAAMSGYAVAGQLVREDRSRFQRQTRFWAKNVARGIGLEVVSFGGERLDPRGTYVLMANHQSHVDIIALFNALPMVPGFLAKAELRRVPLFGRAMEVGGHVFVERGRHKSAVHAISAAAADVSRGSSIVIFPEGTRSTRREVLPFKKGGFHLAKQAGVPIVPIGIRGTADVLPKYSRELRPGRCEVHIGEPIDADRVRELPLGELMAEVRAETGRLSQLPLAADRSGV